jgi:hypothetical protein
MLESACKKDKGLKGDQIQLERTQSNLKLANADFPLLSLFRNLGMYHGPETHGHKPRILFSDKS